MTTQFADHETALSKAKIQLMARPDSVFFTTLCFSLKHFFGTTVSTAATDGKTVEYNPDFFMGLAPMERVSLLLHETLHCAYSHMDRRGERNHHKFNRAADFAINLQLRDRGFPIPSNWLCEERYRSLSAEEIYGLLPDDPTPPPMNDLRPSKTPAEADAMAKDMQDILIRASLASKMAGDKPGTIPGDIEIFLNRLLNPKLPWNRILQKYLQSFSKNDYSMQRPNRRFMPKHYLPSLYSESLLDIAIAVDASGSVSDSEFLRFVTETHSIVRMLKPKKIDLITFDTSIKSVETIRSVTDLMKVTFTGRGGTLIEPIIQWANEHKPQLMLVFTDGGFRFYGHTTKVPLTWLIHNNPGFTAPYGRVIHYET